MPLAPFGGVALGLVIAGSADSTVNNRLGLGLLVGALTAIIPERISYNIKWNELSSIAPYIKPITI
jgi:hypothetical protein